MARLEISLRFRSCPSFSHRFHTDFNSSSTPTNPRISSFQTFSQNLNIPRRPIPRILLPNVGRLRARRGAHAPRLVARAEVVGALERDGLGRVLAEEEDGGRHAGRVLAVLVGALVRRALGAGVVGHVLASLRHGAALELPPACDVVDVVEGEAGEF